MNDDIFFNNNIFQARCAYTCARARARTRVREYVLIIYGKMINSSAHMLILTALIAPKIYLTDNRLELLSLSNLWSVLAIR